MIGSSSTTSPASSSWPSRVEGPSETATTVRRPTHPTLRAPERSCQCRVRTFRSRNALDDISEENGAVYLLPYSRSGIKSYIKHIPDPLVNDKVCYFGSDPGIPMTAPAGSIVVFSSVVIHRSGPNLTNRLRRAYIAQYSKEVITLKGTNTPWGSFEHFLDGGRVVAGI